MKSFVLLAGVSLASLGLAVNSPVQAAAPGDSGLKNLPVVAVATPCEALGHSDFSGVADAPTQITSAQTETDARTGKTYCHVTGFVAPQVKFEMKLPDSNWTQRLLMTGCGGLCGNIHMSVEHANSCLPAREGELAIVATDMGHEGNGGVWAAGDKELRTDFAYRGVHVVTLAAKAIVARYYGQAQAYSYFSGCSDGGREALMEAQRFPDDFDGIAAGAPAMNFEVQNSFYHAWNAVANTGPDGQAILLPARLPILHAAVVKACDGLDGVKDGIIADPTRCQFDVATLQCAPGQDTNTCLTPAETEVARRVYAGAHDDQGNRFVAGALMPGSELAWQGVEVPFAPGAPVPAAMFATDSVKYLLHWPELPANWQVGDFKFDMANFQDIAQNHALYAATDPDLSKFFGHGGRLLMWHGWSDPHISPINSIAYYRAVEATLGADATRQGMRFYVFPGLYHCGGGDGLNQFDTLSAIMAWVESGKAPDTLAAGHIDQTMMPGGPPSAMPKPGAQGLPPLPAKMPVMMGPPPETDIVNPVTVKPYPLLADFVTTSGKALKTVNGYTAYVPADWAGAGFYKPYKHQTCAWNGDTYACTTAE